MEIKETILLKLKSHLFDKSVKTKSQPNIFQTKKPMDNQFIRQTKLKPIQTKYKTIKPYIKSSYKQNKISRPISSLQCSKKLIEDYHNTNTTPTSRKPTKPSTKVTPTPNQFSLRNTERKRNHSLIKNTASFGGSFTKAYESFNPYKINAEQRLQPLEKRVHEPIVLLFSQQFKTISDQSEVYITKMKKSEEELTVKQDSIIKVKIRKVAKESMKQSKRQQFIYDTIMSNASMDLSINERISNMYAWDNKRKHKIEEMKKESIQRELRNVFSKPKINKGNPNNITQTNSKERTNTKSVIRRLYKEDPIRIKEKRNILIKILEPSFTPRVNSTRNTYSRSNNQDVFQSNNIQLNHLSHYTESLIRDKLFNNNINNTYSS